MIVKKILINKDNLKDRINSHFKNRKISKDSLSNFISDKLGYRYHKIDIIYDRDNNLSGFMIDFMDDDKKVFIKMQWK